MVIAEVHVFDLRGHRGQRRQLFAVSRVIARLDVAGQFGGVVDRGGVGHLPTDGICDRHRIPVIRAGFTARSTSIS
jgi:hypothetical protein